MLYSIRFSKTTDEATKPVDASPSDKGKGKSKAPKEDESMEEDDEEDDEDDDEDEDDEEDEEVRLSFFFLFSSRPDALIFAFRTKKTSLWPKSTPMWS